MEQNDKFKDWLFRYQYVYRLRRTEKSKQRFLKALVTDLSELREDVQVIEYNRQKRQASRNVYVGDIEKADRIICTYYDTPPQSIGSYPLFNRREQARRTTHFIIISSFILILLGYAGTLLYARNTSFTFDWGSWQTVLFIAVFGCYFFLLGKVTQGLSARHTLVRNTSSILSMLLLIRELRTKKVAFAFIDEGCFGDKGLEALQSSANKKSELFLLDSVGAVAPLHASGAGVPRERTTELNINHIQSAGKINFIYCGRGSVEEKNNGVYLNRSDLKKKQLNMDNLEKVVKLFQ